jgi:hypothetical protein
MSASASRAAMTRMPTRFRWPSKGCGGAVVDGVVALLLLDRVERQ